MASLEDMDPELVELLCTAGRRWGLQEVAVAAARLTERTALLAMPDRAGLEQRGQGLRWVRRVLLPKVLAGDPAAVDVATRGLLGDVRDDLERERLRSLDDLTMFVRAVEVSADGAGRPRYLRCERFEGPPPGWCNALELSMEVSVSVRDR